LEPENRFGQPSKILGAGIDPVPGSKNPHPCKLRKDAAPRISKSPDAVPYPPENLPALHWAEHLDLDSVSVTHISPE
jgi:hypothetical protein